MKIIHKDYCSHCKEEHEHMTPYTKKYRKNGTCVQYYHCHACNNKRARKYYKENKEKCRAIIYKSIAKYPEKQSAREKLNYAVRAGKIKKPDCCSKCGVVPKKIEADHRDYSKPLEVTWLCTPCHNLMPKV